MYLHRGFKEILRFSRGRGGVVWCPDGGGYRSGMVKVVRLEGGASTLLDPRGELPDAAAGG